MKSSKLTMRSNGIIKISLSTNLTIRESLQSLGTKVASTFSTSRTLLQARQHCLKGLTLQRVAGKTISMVSQFPGPRTYRAWKRGQSGGEDSFDVLFDDNCLMQHKYRIGTASFLQ